MRGGLREASGERSDKRSGKRSDELVISQYTQTNNPKLEINSHLKELLHHFHLYS